MPYETILTDLADNIFTITINRPDKFNALNTLMIRELLDAFDTADADDAVIAAVNGAAVGIGVTMLLPMDVRIASSEARFGFVFSQRGIVLEAASSWFLPRIVGIAQALEWCYSGRVFGAQEALAGKLVSRVVAPEELLPAARALAREFT